MHLPYEYPNHLQFRYSEGFAVLGGIPFRSGLWAGSVWKLGNEYSSIENHAGDGRPLFLVGRAPEWLDGLQTNIQSTGVNIDRSIATEMPKLLVVGVCCTTVPNRVQTRSANASAPFEIGK